MNTDEHRARKARNKREERDRRRKAGLVSVTVWVKPEHREAVKQHAADMVEREGSRTPRSEAG